MVKRLRRSYKKNQLTAIGDDKAVSAKLDELMANDWVVYSKAYYQNSEVVLGYLARYTYRIAISERRILRMDEQSVSFEWKDYRDDSSRKVMKLSGVEFVRRFFLHILPSGLMRIRHFGFMANCHRKKKLECIRQCLQHAEEKAENDSETITICESHVSQIETQQPIPCPRCDEGHLLFFKEIEPNRGRMPLVA
jgi:hypothetical protein